MADINYKGLTGLLGTVTVDLATDTFDTLIAAIASDEGLPTDYYHVALERDPSKNDRDFADSSTPLTLDDVDIAMVDGDTVICTPNQNSLTKQERQVMKLEIAQLKRQGGSAGDTSARYYRTNNPYDLTSLPDTYNDNLPGADDNPNPGGLLEGRPWATSAVTALFTSLGAEFEIIVDDTTGISPGMIMTGMDYGGATVTVVTVNSSTSLEMSIIAPDTVPAAGTVLTFTNP